MPTKNSKIPLIDAKLRFWSNVQTDPDTRKCWPYLHDQDENDYGRISIKGKKIRGHRFSYMIHYNLTEEEMKGITIRHTCDNPRCVNPSHLLPGTTADNMQDKVDRNRQQKGEGVPGVKLTATMVKEIRELHDTHTITQTRLAELYGVSLGAINDLILHKTWKHVT